MKTIPLLSCLALICATGCKQHCDHKYGSEYEAYQKGYEDAYIFVLRQVNTANSYIGPLKMDGGTNVLNPSNCLFFAVENSLEISEDAQVYVYNCRFLSGFTPISMWIPPAQPVEQYLKQVTK